MKGFKGKIKKKITIKLIGDAEKAFNDLNRIVGEQRSQGITSSKDITLLNSINRIFDVIVNNPFYGENAKKDLIPKEYRQKYDADNIFIVDLPIPFTPRMPVTLPNVGVGTEYRTNLFSPKRCMGFLVSCSGKLIIFIECGAAFGHIPQPVHNSSSMDNLPSSSILMHSWPVLFMGQMLFM